MKFQVGDHVREKFGLYERGTVISIRSSRVAPYLVKKRDGNTFYLSARDLELMGETMTKFKIGDKLRCVGEKRGLGWREDLVFTVKRISEATIESEVVYWGALNSNGVFGDSVELVTSKEDKPMARRTFKLLKDTHAVKKGALYQEDCEDGTQSYSIITKEFLKNNLSHKDEYKVKDRSIIEEQPEWFIEVFKVEPEYMTREDLERYHSFLKGPKPKTVSKKRKYVKSGKYTKKVK